MTETIIEKHACLGRSRRPAGAVRLDAADPGGECAGGKAGGGAGNKKHCVAAGSVDGRRQPPCLKRKRVSGFTAMAKWAQASLLPGTVVTSAGLGGFAAAAETGCILLPTRVSHLKPRDLPEFNWVSTVPSNLKTPLAGAVPALKCRTRREHGLAAIAYRLDRRSDLRGLVARRIVGVGVGAGQADQGKGR